MNVKRPSVAYADAPAPQEPVGSIPGVFQRMRERLFGRLDPVQAQLRDLERQGTFGARISHVFAGFLIVLFSAASLIALGADSVRAVLRSIALGTLDIPNTVATGVTGLLVPCMDVAILRAASKIRILATRRASRSELALHIGVVAGISVIEACTYCYMSAIYQHPSGAADWALIAARAFAAPLIGVYLAMDRPHPVTSRDILAQVELGAGAGVIRDVTEIANDPSATLDRKMELFGASAVMREGERQRLDDLIEVAKRHSGSAVLPASHARIVAASLEAPATRPLRHSMPLTMPSLPDTYRAMHDGYGGDDYGITDEVLDEVGADEDLFGTFKLDRDELESAVSVGGGTSNTKHSPRGRRITGPNKVNQDRSRAVREYNRKIRVDAKAARRSAIRDAVYAILDEWHAAGRTETISDKALAKRVAERVDFDVNPSGNTVARWRGPWQSSRTHKAQVEREAETQDAPEMELEEALP